MKNILLKWIPIFILSLGVNYSVIGMCGSAHAVQTCPMKCCDKAPSNTSEPYQKACCHFENQVHLALIKAVDTHKKFSPINGFNALPSFTPIQNKTLFTVTKLPSPHQFIPLYILKQSFLC